MCGRFTITLEPAFFQQEFDLGNIPSEWTPRYNVAPTQKIPVVKNFLTRDVEMLRWGLVPHWAKDLSIGYRLINARSETLSEKPSFRNAFEKRRCLVLADGFFEWQTPEKKGAAKTPYRFALKDGKPFAFAGLWETWHSPEKEEILSCTIITCEPNEMIAQVHNRMPVILDRENCWSWLEVKSQKELSDFLKPFPSEKMEFYPVSLNVNNPREENPGLIRPLSL